MAAILCQGINELCKLMCVPCKACGLGCRSLGEVLTSPFFPYLAVTYALNVPAVVYGIQGFTYRFSHASNYCGIGTTWLMVNTLLAAAHLIASWYLVYTIRQDRDMSQMILGSQSPYNNDYGTAPVAGTATTTTTHLHAATTGTDDAAVAAAKMEQGTYQPPPPTNPNIFAKAIPMVTGRAAAAATTTPTVVVASASGSPGAGRSTGASNSMTRIKYVLCYDPLVAIYMIIFFVWVVWQSIGTSRAFKLGGLAYCGTVSDWTMVSVICGYLYMGLVGIAFLCSLCCLR